MSFERPYFRPLTQVGPARPDAALTLAGGWCWFTHVEVLERGKAAHVVPASDVALDVIQTLTASRSDIIGLSMDRPRVMGILNVTPDSFSDGGDTAKASDAVAAGVAMFAAGVDLLDVGGESTRPGAATVAVDQEIARVRPVIAGLRDADVTCPISIDTRKAVVAQAAHRAGANLVNDVSGFTFDADLAPYCAAQNLPICVMHALGDPATMQQDPQYENVLLDVYDFLERQIATLVAAGVPRKHIVADPGIGFGKNMQHNLTLLARLGLFHGLGVPILLGASRKRFIGTIGNAPDAKTRAPGSIGVGLSALASGIQMLRVHDVPETIQAMALWQAATLGSDR